MKSIPSSEFRTEYGRLVEPTFVTVNGHPIGLWLPGPNAGIKQVADEALTEEVAHLKRELARRPGGELVFDNGPVDEPRVRRETTEARRERQKVIDEALRKVNRTKKGKP